MFTKTTFLNLLVSFSLLACSTLNASETPGRSPFKVSYRGLFSKNEDQQRTILLKAGFESESSLTDYLINLNADNDDELTRELQAKFPDLLAIDELIVIIDKLKKQSRSSRSTTPEPSTSSGASADQKTGDNPTPRAHGLPEPVGAQKTGQKKSLLTPEETLPKKPTKSGNYFKKVAVLSTVAVTSYLTYRYVQEQRSENALLNNKIS